MSEFIPMKHNKRFFTAGTLIILAIMAVGYGVALARLLVGLNPVTNLSNSYPWGIWIAIDVASGVALAAGGFTTAALVNIIGKRKFHDLERAALLTAWLGYTFVGLGLMLDLGRYYNIWHPAVYWQGNSALFEVGLCVMFYLTVLTVEFTPTLMTGIIEKAAEGDRLAVLAKRVLRPAEMIRWFARRVMPIFIIAGVVLSCMHQSSLGTLMLIAPTKMNHLWWTPILSVNFLLSAIMVGFPMVIFESIIASEAFDRKQEMALLEPLSRYIPWFIGLYAVVRFTDFFWRNDASLLMKDESATVALAVEVGVGLIIPFIMLMRKSVRSCHRCLLAAVSMIIAGVVINRINVFLTAYQPIHAQGSYFPSIGEIAITAGLIATIVFVYRFFVMYFPVLPGTGDPNEEQTPVAPPTAASIWARAAQVGSVLIIIGFAGIYAWVHYSAEERTRETLQEPNRSTEHAVHEDLIKMAGPTELFTNPMPIGITISHPMINRLSDFYEPVRFMHRSHAAYAMGDCTVCHHRIPENEKDRTGKEITYLDLQKIRIESCNNCHDFTLANVQQTHADVRGDCSVCHHRNDPEFDREDLDVFKFTSCAACHGLPNEALVPARPGLKGIYHQQCIGCHKKEHSIKAPTDCTSCHAKRAPDHQKYISLGKSPRPSQVVAKCVDCHEHEASEMPHSLHWKRIPKDKQDCLICHDTTGTYKRDEKKPDALADGVDIVKVAKSVGAPTRASCGSCHFVKNSQNEPCALNPDLTKPSPETDVHMGKHNMVCQDCHETHEHRIPGQSLALSHSDGRVTCQQCHGETPHRIYSPLGFHLDKHEQRVTCQLCHIVDDTHKSKVAWYSGRYAIRDPQELKMGKESTRSKIIDAIEDTHARLIPYRDETAPDKDHGYRTHLSINHEVAPIDKALKCTDCHSKETVSCLVCHQSMSGFNVDNLMTPNYPDAKSKWLDFEALGYEGDPARNSWFRKPVSETDSDSQ